MNILVEGSRGKSGTVETIVRAFEALGEDIIGKITGNEPLIFYKGQKIPINRASTGFLIDQENIPIMQRFKDVKFKVFENQALSCYSMRVVHNIFKPDIIAIPNIRFEHQDRLGETIEEIAKSFAENFKGAKVVITTEPKKCVLETFEKYCRKYNVELIIVDKPETIPSIQYLHLAEEVVRYALNRELPAFIKKAITNDIEKNIMIKISDKHGLHFFHGAKVNDVESTTNIIRYLRKQTDKRFCIVSYFRKDRVERNEAFIPFFMENLNDDFFAKFFMVGHTVGLPKHNKVEYIEGLENDKIKVIDFCRENDLVLFTAVNGVCPFMRGLHKDLSGK